MNIKIFIGVTLFLTSHVLCELPLTHQEKFDYINNIEFIKNNLKNDEGKKFVNESLRIIDDLNNPLFTSRVRLLNEKMNMMYSSYNISHPSVQVISFEDVITPPNVQSDSLLSPSDIKTNKEQSEDSNIYDQTIYNDDFSIFHDMEYDPILSHRPFEDKNFKMMEKLNEPLLNKTFILNLGQGKSIPQLNEQNYTSDMVNHYDQMNKAKGKMMQISLVNNNHSQTDYNYTYYNFVQSDPEVIHFLSWWKSNTDEYKNENVHIRARDYYIRFLLFRKLNSSYNENAWTYPKLVEYVQVQPKNLYNRSSTRQCEEWALNLNNLEHFHLYGKSNVDNMLKNCDLSVTLPFINTPVHYYSQQNNIFNSFSQMCVSKISLMQTGICRTSMQLRAIVGDSVQGNLLSSDEIPLPHMMTGQLCCHVCRRKFVLTNTRFTLFENIHSSYFGANFVMQINGLCIPISNLNTCFKTNSWHQPCEEAQASFHPNFKNEVLCVCRKKVLFNTDYEFRLLWQNAQLNHMNSRKKYKIT